VLKAIEKRRDDLLREKKIIEISAKHVDRGIAAFKRLPLRAKPCKQSAR
jgi:hypothetical protein